MTMGRGVSAMSSYIVHDADALILVGYEFVAFPLTDEWSLWPAWVH